MIRLRFKSEGLNPEHEIRNIKCEGEFNEGSAPLR
jgi:hypothetical protein